MMMSAKKSKKKNQKRKYTQASPKSSEQAASTKASPKKQSAKDAEVNLREPWIKQKSGLITVGIISLALAVLVAYQIIVGSGDWGQGILWGLIFGVSILLIFFGMNWFHSLFNKDKRENQKTESKK